MDEKNGEPLRTSTLSVVKEDDDDDEEIEELVRTSFRKFQSQSAHANLSQMATRSSEHRRMNRKKCSSARFSSRIPEEGNHSQSSNSEEEPISDAERQQEESSDEEFYVHKALQPLRKSKSSAAGFASTASSANNFDQTATIIPLNRRSSRKNSDFVALIEAQTRSMILEEQAQLPAPSNINEIWPEPDDTPKEHARKQSEPKPSYPTVDLRRGDVVTVRMASEDESEADGSRRHSNSSNAFTCWSAPGYLTDEEGDDELRERAARNRVERSWSAPPRIRNPPAEMRGGKTPLGYRRSSSGGRGSLETDLDILLGRRESQHLEYARNTPGWPRHHMSAGDLDLLSGICDLDGSDNESDGGASMFRSQSAEEFFRAPSVHQDLDIMEGEPQPERVVEELVPPSDEAMSTSEDESDYVTDSDEEHAEGAEGMDKVADVISATGMPSRHSQVYLVPTIIPGTSRVPQSKSDSQIWWHNRSHPPLPPRPRTPRGYNEDVNDDADAYRWPPTATVQGCGHVVRHSATYHGVPLPEPQDDAGLLNGCGHATPFYDVGHTGQERLNSSYIRGLNEQVNAFRCHQELNGIEPQASVNGHDEDQSEDGEQSHLEEQSAHFSSVASAVAQRACYSSVEGVGRKADHTDTMSVRSFTLADSDIPMADDPTEDTPLSAAFVAKRRLPVRRSPPIASEDDDISDLDSDEEYYAAAQTEAAAAGNTAQFDPSRQADTTARTASFATATVDSSSGRIAKLPESEHAAAENTCCRRELRGAPLQSPQRGAVEELSCSSSSCSSTSQFDAADAEECRHRSGTVIRQEFSGAALEKQQVGVISAPSPPPTHQRRRPPPQGLLTGSSSMPSFTPDYASGGRAFCTPSDESCRPFQRVPEPSWSWPPPAASYYGRLYASQYGNAEQLRKSQTQASFEQMHASMQQSMDQSMTGGDQTRPARPRRRMLPMRPDMLPKPTQQSSTSDYAIVRESPVGYVPGPAPSSQQLASPCLPPQQQQRPIHPVLPTPITPSALLPHFTPPPNSGSGQRRLPPLPVHPSSSAYLPELAPFYHMSLPRAMSSHEPSPSAVPGPSMMSGQNAQDYHHISYGIDESMVRSESNCGMADSYYEDTYNGNSIHFGGRKMSAYNHEDSSGISSCCTSTDPPGPTHRAQFRFVPRHADEILLETGDAIHVERECEDNWCFGTNLRTGQQGIFPAAQVCEIDLVEEICKGVLSTNVQSPPQPERDTFYLTMLASVEVAHHKGNDVLVQAINKVCEMYQRKEEILVPQTVLMEISFRGIHVIDKRKKDFFRCPSFDYFYSLQNISFCGAHPKQLRYFGFVTKHPLLPRFACHVFLSNESTQAIVESIGRAFKRSYDEYMAFAHPTEDIYIE
ncbi:Protein JIP-1 c [Aphelenchoides avenae]|nr:Protein JIP-1 c [Aphelenchus avenae]